MPTCQIMSMANMKDAERLELLKEIGGTKVRLAGAGQLCVLFAQELVLPCCPLAGQPWRPALTIRCVLWSCHRS